MVSEKKVFVTTDGKEYKTEKSAKRHENELVIKNKGFTVKEMNEWVVKVGERNHIVKSLLRTKPDWRDWGGHLIKQLPEQVEAVKQDIVVYQLVKFPRWTSRKPEVLKSVKVSRLPEGEVPKELQEYVDAKTKESKSGSTFDMVLHETSDWIKVYAIKEVGMSVEDKISKGIELSEEDLKELVFGYAQVHEVEGSSGRWDTPVTTVVQLPSGDLYAVDWSRGLTESHENTFMNQPQKVELEEKEVVTVVTNIKYL